MNIKEEKYPEYTIWRTANSKEIPLEEMSTTHIINSINKIKASGNTWRGDWLPYLEKELGRRNMFVGSKERDSRMISEGEMIYFLETSCDNIIVRGKKEILQRYKGVVNNEIENYLSCIFSLPGDKDVMEFIDTMLSDVSRISASDFYKKYDPYKLDNAFEVEWKSFIDLMLGRKEKS